MKWAGVGSRDKGTTLKVKRLCVWTRFLDKLEGSQNNAMLDGFTLVRNPLVAKKKNNPAVFDLITALQGQNFYYPHFTAEGTSAQSVNDSGQVSDCFPSSDNRFHLKEDAVRA